MAKVADLYDDFTTVGLDATKWATTSVLTTMVPSGGVKMPLPSGSPGYSIVTSSRYYDLSTGSPSYLKVDAVPSTTGSAEAQFFLIQQSGGYKIGFSLTAGQLNVVVRNSSDVDIYSASSVWNFAQMRWWKIYYSTSGKRIYFQTSPDGISWTTRGSWANTLTLTSMKVSLAGGWYNASSVGTGAFQVRYFNVRSNQSKGTGYLTENFQSLPTGYVFPANKSSTQWRLLFDGEGTANFTTVQGSTNRYVKMACPTGGYLLMRSDKATKIKDVDYSIDVTTTTRSGFASARVLWRVVDTSNYYLLSVFTDSFIVQRISGGVATDITTVYLPSKDGVTYRWRIVHVGNEIIVYRDGGDYAHTGRITRPAEQWRGTDTTSAAKVAGHVGFAALNVTVTFDNVTVVQGRTPQAPPRTFPFKRRRFGWFTDGLPTDRSEFTALEQSLGKRADIASFFLDWALPYPLADCTALADTGHDLLISWEPTGVRTADIASGAKDAYIKAWADGVAATDATVYVRVMPEMNGDWTPWSVPFDQNIYGVNDLSKSCHTASFAQFKAAWQHIVQVFRDRGVSNVQWVFCVNNADEPFATNALEDYYPGDDYVDVLSIDGYNWGTRAPGGNGPNFQWQTHADVFSMAYDRLCALHPTKPIWISEFGTKEPEKNDATVNGVADPTRAPVDPSHSKGTWLKDLLEDTAFARVEALCYFSVKKERDWRIDSSATSLNAARAEFASSSGVSQGEQVVDPENSPQPVSFGWEPSTSVGQFEYIRLEEDGYLPLQITPSYGGIWLTDIDLGFPVVRAVTEAKPLLPGEVDYTRLAGAKSVSLSFSVMDYLGASVAYQIDLIARWMQPHRRPTMVFKPKGGVEQQMVLRANALGRPMPMRSRESVAVSAQFSVPDGRSFATEQRYAVVSPADDAPAQLLNFGTAQSEPVIRIWGPCTNPVLFNDSLDTEDIPARLGLADTIEDGTYVELDVAQRTVQLMGYADDSANRRALLTTRAWFSLLPFRNYLRMTSDEGTGYAEVFWNDGFA